MLTETLIALFERDLQKLKTEIELYSDENLIWKTDYEIANSAGNLVLHLIGNLNTYIGAELGKAGYVRNRPLEFSLKDIPRTKLLSEIDKTLEIVINTLNLLTNEDLEKTYPQLVFEKEMTTGFFLVHLSTHLAYHLGQINYHRRVFDFRF
ncbi:DinB family protein [Flavobacterium hungaricum]|uniref:DinB family protein n=1 Tax=Flavobacterium hungaricum TaxID=2082725 RepID=A0ABR9TE11_9FLAO|nr:DinB family protein [Flavobacterium hungaricum]MBE8723573.1 DinB family protein [Flavobacterium hungaricum]